MTSIVEPEELGRRIRKRRLELRLTLKQLEEASGLSATHLSEIERGRTSPTIGALIRVARSLKSEPAYLIEPEERTGAVRTTRGVRPTEQAAPGVRVENLSPGIPGSSVHAYALRLDPGSTLVLEPSSPSLEALYFVTRGVVDLDIGDAAVELKSGDSAQTTLAAPQRLRIGPGAEAEVIAVVSHPIEELMSGARREGEIS